MLDVNKVVRSLEEELREVGLDPDKTLSTMDRTTALVEQRVGGSGGGSPPVATVQDPRAVEHRGLQLVEGGGGEDLDEAFKIIRKKRVTSAERLKSKRGRRKKRGALKKAAKAYRKRSKRKIAKRRAKKLAKFGRAGLKKLAKMGRRITMSANDELANLREDLNTGSTGEAGESPFEEAAYNAGLLSMYLGEIFEASGDQQSAETMFDLSDAAADLADDMERLGEEEELEEAEEERLQHVLGGVVKALRVYEGMGALSLLDAISYGEVRSAAE